VISGVHGINWPLGDVENLLKTQKQNFCQEVCLCSQQHLR
jgi:hypothetical protein